MKDQKGIILNSISYKNTSKIFKLITPIGVISLYVKGFKRTTFKYKNILSIGNEIMFTSNDRDLKIFYEGKLLNNFKNTQEDLTKYKYKIMILKLIIDLQETLSDFEHLYAMLLNTLNMLDNISVDNISYVYNIFLIKLLFYCGLNPNTNSCSECNSNEKDKLYVSQNGFTYCDKCIDIKELYKVEDYIKYYKYNYNVNEENTVKDQNTSNFLKNYYLYHLSKDITK